MDKNARPLSEFAVNSLPLLGTPAGRDWKGNPEGPSYQNQKSLPRDIAMLATPRATDGDRGSESPEVKKARGYGASLQDQAEHLLATPNARDYKGSPSWKEQKSLPRDIALLPTPNAMDAEVSGMNISPEAAESQLWRGTPHRRNTTGSLAKDIEILKLLPTPSAGVFNDGESLESWESRRQGNLAKGINGNGQGTPLSIAAQTLDNAPEATPRWGRYTEAIERWETVLGRPAPPPTTPGRTGPRLNPALAEWMMGLPEGWVTEVPGLSRKGQLKAIGNGCCPAQCALALRILLARMNEHESLRNLRGRVRQAQE
jgi:hypothetical protein